MSEDRKDRGATSKKAPRNPAKGSPPKRPTSFTPIQVLEGPGLDVSGTKRTASTGCGDTRLLVCVGAHHALPTSGHPPEVTKGMALVLLLGALFTVFTLLGKLSPEDVALEAEVVAVEKVAGDWREGVLSTLACWQNKKARTCGSGDKAQGCTESGLALGPAARGSDRGAMCSALTVAAHCRQVRPLRHNSSAKYRDY